MKELIEMIKDFRKNFPIMFWLYVLVTLPFSLWVVLLSEVENNK